MSSLLFGLWHVLPPLDTLRLTPEGTAVREARLTTRG